MKLKYHLFGMFSMLSIFIVLQLAVAVYLRAVAPFRPDIVYLCERCGRRMIKCTGKWYRSQIFYLSSFKVERSGSLECSHKYVESPRGLLITFAMRDLREFLRLSWISMVACLLFCVSLFVHILRGRSSVSSTPSATGCQRQGMPSA